MRDDFHLNFQDSVTVHTKIRPKDVPGTLLNVVRIFTTFLLDSDFRGFTLLYVFRCSFNLGFVTDGPSYDSRYFEE